MCNLYNLTTNQQAIRDIARVMQDSLGNLEPDLDIYPDRPAPVVRNTAHGRELARLTWGMPTPPQFLKTKDAPDTASPTSATPKARIGVAGWMSRTAAWCRPRPSRNTGPSPILCTGLPRMRPGSCSSSRASGRRGRARAAR